MEEEKKEDEKTEEEKREEPKKDYITYDLEVHNSVMNVIWEWKSFTPNKK